MTTAQDQQSHALWIDPNDKTRAQYLPHIGEAVLFKHSGRVYTGKHTGGSFKADYPLGKSFTTWDCVWMYPAELDTAAQVLTMGRVPQEWQAVPMESTRTMKAAGRQALKGAADCTSTGQAVIVFKAMCAAAPRPPAAPATTEPPAPTTGAGSATTGAAPAYRLLQRDIDTIQADDEFLSDDAVTWRADPQGIFVGMAYMSNVLRPARRAIEPGP